MVLTLKNASNSVKMNSALGWLMQNFPYFTFISSFLLLKSLVITLVSSRDFSSSGSMILEEFDFGWKIKIILGGQKCLDIKLGKLQYSIQVLTLSIFESICFVKMSPILVMTSLLGGVHKLRLQEEGGRWSKKIDFL